jgi:NAD-dependent deacetylase sirtuin 2
MSDYASFNIGINKLHIHDHLMVRMNRLRPLFRAIPFNNDDNFNSNTTATSNRNDNPLKNCNITEESSNSLNDKVNESLEDEMNKSKENIPKNELKNTRSVPDVTTISDLDYVSIRSFRRKSLSTSDLDALENEKSFIAKFAEKFSAALGRIESKIKNFDTGICSDLTIDLNTMVRILNEDTLIGIADYIKEHQCKNIIVMSGAGISTNAEIPDFRSADRGVYANLEKYNIPYPEAIFELEYFKKNPKPFTMFAKEIYPQNIRPTKAHCFIKLLNNHNILLRHYTQNIDGLDYQTRLDSDLIIESHGSFHQSYCVGTSESESCGSVYSQSWYKEKLFKGENPIVCPKCQGYVKPGVIFFGENLPSKFFESLRDDIQKCDLLLILGTSLKVYPFASIVKSVSKKIPRCLINNTLPDIFESELLCDGSNAEYIFSGNQYQRDVTYIGDCDKGCTELARALGWEDELMEIYENEIEYANKYFN